MMNSDETTPVRCHDFASLFGTLMKIEIAAKPLAHRSETVMARSVMVASAELHLDPRNPRLNPNESSPQNECDILKLLWSDWNVREIADSIVTSGSFWTTEPLIAVREGRRLIVVKGNRRLAAVKILLSSRLRDGIGVSPIAGVNHGLLAKIRKLPVVVSTRRKVWPFLAFRHVNGPKEWDSIARAQYIARIHEEFDIPLPDIAKAIGDRNTTVQRLYHGLKVLHQAQDAGVFDPSDRYHQKKDFAYSHLWTGLGYEGIRSFLGITEGAHSKRKPVPESKISALGDVCRWLYGSHAEKVEPLVKSQNPHLRLLDEAVRATRGVAALRRGLPLQHAVNAARGDTRLLLDALVAAEQNLREAKGYFSTGFTGQQEVVETVNNINSLASSLHADVQASKPRSQ